MDKKIDEQDVLEQDNEQEVTSEVGTNEDVSTDTGEKSVSQDGENEEEQDSFPRSYVEKLRKESAGYRERAQQADVLAQRLHAALVAADGRLADPEDLPFNEEHLDDPEALAAAITALVEKKPGLRAQQVRGDVGAGSRGSSPAPKSDLLSIIRGMQ